MNTDRSDNTAVPDTEHNVIVTIHSSNNVNDTDEDYNTSNSNIDVDCSSNSDTDVNISFSCTNDQPSHNELNILMLNCCGVKKTVELS